MNTETYLREALTITMKYIPFDLQDEEVQKDVEELGELMRLANE